MLPTNWSQPKSHRLRIGRASLSDCVYLVTFTTKNRKPLLQDFEAARLACRVLSGPDAWPHARPLAWVAMPDHWHGLIELGPMESLSRSAARAKAATTRRWNEAYDSTGSLWAPGFHDHALRCEESLLACARYIVLNPVRAGLVPRCGLYPFWDAIWL